MKSRKTSSPLDGLKEFKETSEENRQIAYENKVSKKIVTKLLRDDKHGYTYWEQILKTTVDPLLTLQGLVPQYSLRSFRLEKWGINDLYLRPTKCPVWAEYLRVGTEMGEAFPDAHPALVFYNATLSQDMVIHNNIDATPPKGYFRMVRVANSGEGGVVVDTLPGFLETL